MIKKILNFILNFFLSLLVLGLICLNVAYNTVLKKDYIKEMLEKNNFYSRAYSDIKSNFENYTIQSGIELEVLDEVLTQEMVSKDIDNRIDYIYGGKKVETSSSIVREKLENIIIDTLKEKNREPTETERVAIDKYEDAIVDAYEMGILYKVDYQLDSKIIETIKTARTACIITIVVISIILLILNRSILKYISIVGVSFLFSGILCGSLKFLLEKRIAYIMIFDKKFSNFLVNSLTDILGKLYQLGIIFGSIGIVLIIIGSFEKFKKTIENKND